jgi:hypothetical protein
MPLAILARPLGISRLPVDAYRRRDTPPGPRPLQRPPSARVLTPDVPSRIRRWRESGADSRPRWRELQRLGSTHAARTVGRFITRRRRAADAGQAPEAPRSPDLCPQGPSARAGSCVMVGPAATRSAEAQTSLDPRGQIDAGIARGLQDDLRAITAGLTLGWSHGAVEGQVTRLKLLKRQGYGRAGVPL